MNTAMNDAIEEYATFTDRLRNPVNEDRAMALSINLEDQPEGESSHTLTAFTRDPELKALATALSEKATEDGGYLTVADATTGLKAIQTQFQLNDDDWGALSPYLEELIAAEHPHVRLKTPGKYNAEGRHKVLMRTRPGEGGWSPALVIPSRDAERMWASAGLNYPKNLKGASDEQVAHHADRYEKAPLSYAISRRRRLRQKIKDIHLELEALTSVIRKDSLEDTQRSLPDVSTTFDQAKNTGESLKAQKHVIEACLTAISIDQEVDTHDPEFQIFARALNIIERDIGRSNTKEALKNDRERIGQAAAITRSLIASLPNDSIGKALQDTLNTHLDHVTRS